MRRRQSTIKTGAGDTRVRTEQKSNTHTHVVVNTRPLFVLFILLLSLRSLRSLHSLPVSSFSSFSSCLFVLFLSLPVSSCLFRSLHSRHMLRYSSSGVVQPLGGEGQCNFGTDTTYCGSRFLCPQVNILLIPLNNLLIPINNPLTHVLWVPFPSAPQGSEGLSATGLQGLVFSSYCTNIDRTDPKG